ncbi:hypothetical protein ES703_112544 [subsurface metagenome]
MRRNIRGKKLAEKTKKLKEGQLYECSVCGATAYIDKKTKQLLIQFPPLELPKTIAPFQAPITISLPYHDDCELNKIVDQIDLEKLEKVKVKKK